MWRFSCPEWHRVFSWSSSHSFQGCLCLPRWPFLCPVIINKVMWHVPDVIRDAAHIFYHSALFIAEVMISGWNPLPSAACWSVQNMHHKWACSELSGRRWRLGMSFWKSPKRPQTSKNLKTLKKKKFII